MDCCPACQSKRVEKMFSMGYQPLSLVAMTPDKAESRLLDSFPIKLNICRNCTHVYNELFNPENVYYDSAGCRMYNSGAGWQEHIKEVKEMLETPDVELVVEIGAGDCKFLADLNTSAVKLAVDPCEAVLAAEEYGLQFDRALFDARIHMPRGAEGTLVIMRHLLEHLEYPRALLEDIAMHARDQRRTTWLYIEVPCCEEALKTGRFEDWTYEHPQHFTVNSMRALLHNCGWTRFVIYKKYGGEVLSVLVQIEPDDHVAGLDVNKTILKYRDVREGINEVHEWLVSHSVAFWGGAGKAAMFLRRVGITTNAVVVDSHDEKWGMCVPGTDIVMLSPAVLKDEPVDYIVATTAWRADDIRREIKERGIECKALLKFENGKLVEVPLGQ